MADELWRQWQALAASWMAPNPASPTAHEWPGAPGLAALAEGAERFKAAAQSFIDGAAGGSASAAGQAAERFGEFLREQFGGTPPPWGAGPGPAGSGTVPPGSGFDGPALGATREYQLRWQRMSEAWRRIDGAQRHLQRLWSDALREAAAAFTAQWLGQPVPGQPVQMPGPTAPPELYDAWIDCAEAAYARMAHGEAFCSAQAEFVNASGQWRQELQALIEQSAKLLDLPTRSEINTLSRRLKSVEEHLRAAAPAVQRAPGAAQRTRAESAQNTTHAKRRGAPRSRRRAKP